MAHLPTKLGTLSQPDLHGQRVITLPRNETPVKILGTAAQWGLLVGEHTDVWTPRGREGCSALPPGPHPARVLYNKTVIGTAACLSCVVFTKIPTLKGVTGTLDQLVRVQVAWAPLRPVAGI